MASGEEKTGAALPKTGLRLQLFVLESCGKWLLLGSVMGVLIGLLGTSFHWCIDTVTEQRIAHPWLLFLLPVAGVALVGLYHAVGLRQDKGTNLVLLAVRDNEKMTLRHMVCIYVGSVLTHLCGGSSGREGAALQIGGSVAAKCGRLLHLDEQDNRLMVMSGMSACFSALFGTPIAAAFFAMEVVSVGILHYSALVPCMVASVIGCTVSGYFGVVPLSMDVVIPALSVSVAARVGFLAMLCAALSYLFCLAMHLSGKLYQRFFQNPYLRAACGGVIVILITLLYGTRDYNGAGTDIILAAFATNADWYAFLLKLLLTALTLGAGFKGGEIVPVFFVGATFGSALSGLLQLPPSLGAAIGLVSLFCGVTNCPLTALFLSIELFGAEGMLLCGIAIALSYMLSGYQGLYSEQKILYSKVKPRFINKKIGEK